MNCQPSSLGERRLTAARAAPGGALENGDGIHRTNGGHRFVENSRRFPML